MRSERIYNLLNSTETTFLYCETAEKKAKNSIYSTFISAIMSGIFISLAGLASTTASATVNNPSLAKLISAMVFPGGLALVVLVGTELFTGNSLMIIPWIQKKIRLTDLLKNWFIVWVGNFVGCVLISSIVVKCQLPLTFSGRLAESMSSIASTKLSMAFTDALLRGIGCNFLVCAAVWIALSSKTVNGKIAGLYFPIMFFVVSGFEHSIADMYYVWCGVLLDNLKLSGIFVQCLIPVTIGNVIGGVIFGLFCWIREKA